MEIVESALANAESWSSEEVLQWASARFEGQVAIASAFGAEGIALLDIAAKIFRPLTVFTLDTGYLFPETRRLIVQVEQRYGIQVEHVLPSLTPEAQETIHGTALWKRNPNLCCQIRKIEPLRKKLSGIRAWITAIRRNQTPARANARKVEWNTRFECIKINPLVDWTEEMVWEYIRRHQLDYNVLHDRNYPSIGCMHCTRAIRPGEDGRAGRWAGFSKTACGLHEPASISENAPPSPALAASASHD